MALIVDVVSCTAPIQNTLYFHDNRQNICPLEPDGPAVTEPALSWVMLFDIIVSYEISAYRFTIQYSHHRLQVDQIIMRLDLTEVKESGIRNQESFIFNNNKAKEYKIILEHVLH